MKYNQGSTNHGSYKQTAAEARAKGTTADNSSMSTTVPDRSTSAMEKGTTADMDSARRISSGPIVSDAGLSTSVPDRSTSATEKGMTFEMESNQGSTLHGSSKHAAEATASISGAKHYLNQREGRCHNRRTSLASTTKTPWNLKQPATANETQPILKYVSHTG